MGFNAKHFEIVSTVESGFTDEKIKGVLADLPCEYAYILHDKDVYTKEDEEKNENHKEGQPKAPHYHVYINFGKTTWDSDRVAKRFEVAGNFVNKVKGRQADMEDYLTHRNAPEKFQYADDEVISNYDWQKSRDTKKEKGNRKERAFFIRQKIVDGEWRDYNLHNFINAHEYYEHKKVIDNAFDYRTRLLKGANRNMQAIYIYGDSGTGKTTLAKDMASEHGYSVYVSSGSNDVLDDYRGEDCVILDDLRPSVMGLTDLLKLLDPYTASTVRSRYKNKVLECKMIIITTTLPIKTFFNHVFESEGETAVQLQRRCKAVFHLTQMEMTPYVWQDKSRTYLRMPSQKNPCLSKYELRDMSVMETEEYLSNLLGALAKERKVLPEWEQCSVNDEDLPF